MHRQLQRPPAPDGHAAPALIDVKTKAGRRTLQLDAVLIDVLRKHRANQAEERLFRGKAWRDPFTKQGGLVFTSSTGGPLTPPR